MAENVVDELLIEIRVKTEALERGLAEVDRRLQDAENKAKRSGKGLDEMGKSGEEAGKKTSKGLDESSRGLDENKQKSGEVAAAYGAVGAAGAAAFYQIISAINAGIDKANEYSAAINGLRNQAQGVGASMVDIMQGMDGLTADALISESDTAAAIKNLLNYGFTVDQATKSIERLKDSAAYGREAQYSLGAAVRVTTEGIRMENSVLSNAAGVQKNIAKMIEDYAKSLGKSQTALTQAEKAQAVYNGIMQETEIAVGNAAAYSEEFAGAQQRLAKASADTEKAIGSAASNALEPFYNLLTPIVQGVADFASEYESVVAGLGGSALAFTGIIAVISAYKAMIALATAANISFQSSLGVIGGISLAVGAIVGLIASIKSAKSEMDLLREASENIIAHRQESKALKEGLAVLEDARSTTDELTAAKKALAEQYPELISHFNEEGEAVLKGNDAIQGRIDLVNEEIELEKRRIAASGGAALSRLSDEERQLKQLRDGALVERNDLLDELEDLRKRRDKQLAEQGENYIGYDYVSDLEGAIELVDKEYQELSRLIEDHNARLAEIDRDSFAIRAAQLDVALSEWTDRYGELSEAQMVIAEQARQEALAALMSQESFSALLKERVGDIELIAQVEADLATQRADAAKSTSQWADSEKSLKAAQDANSKAANAAQVKKYADTVKASVKELRDGKAATDEQKEALAALAQYFNISEEAVLGSIGGFSSWADAQYSAAQDLRSNMIVEIQAFIKELGLTEEAAKEAYPHIASIMGMLSGDIADTGKDPKDLKRSSGSSQRKKAWEEELSMMERVKDETREMGNVYVLVLQDMLAQHNLSASERQRLEKELAMAQKEINGELEQEYIAYIQNILAHQKLSAEERLAVEKKLVAAQKDLYRERIESLDALGNAVVDALRARYAAEQEVQAESLAEQMQARQKAASDQKDIINETRDIEVKRLQEVRDADIKAIEERRDADIKAIEERRDTAVAAIEAEIKAIDDYIKARDRSEKDNEDEKKLARLKTELAFEKDAYNQIKLQEQIVQLEKDIARRKEDERLADEKAALKEQLAEVKTSSSDEIKAIKDKAAEQLAITKETAAAQIEMVKESAAQQLKILQAQLDAEIANLQQRQKENEDYWKQRLSDEALMGEALVLLNNGTQEEILQLLKDYNPSYLKAGNEMGQMLYDGFDSKYKDLLARTEQVSQDIIKKANAAIAAWQAMQAITSKSGSSGSSSSMWSASGAAAPFSGLQNFAQQLIALPDTLDNLITGALYNMTEAPRNYYATRAAEAGLDNYAVADFSNGNLNAVTAAGVAARATAAPGDVDTVMSSLGRRKDVNLVVNIYRPEQTPYQTAKEIERISRRLID